MDTWAIVGAVITAVVGAGVFLYRSFSKQSEELKRRRLQDVSYWVSVAYSAVDGIAKKTGTKIDDVAAEVIRRADAALRAQTGQGLSETEKPLATLQAQALDAQASSGK